MLIQVLFEALANSLDAGASEVTIRIEIDGFVAADTLRFTITDNGSGFDDGSFDRFCQLLKPRDAGHKGLGRLVYLNYFVTGLGGEQLGQPSTNLSIFRAVQRDISRRYAS